MELGSSLKPFNREYFTSIGLGCQYQARQHSLAVEIYCAGATFPFAAALFGTGQIESVSEDINQPIPRVHCQFIPVAVDLYLNVDLFH
jgi:hypothetical protein